MIVVILTTSCYTQRGLDRQSEYKVDLFYKENLNGLYENAVPDDPDNSLWQDLYKNKSHREFPFNANNTQVGLELLSDKLLKVVLYRSGIIEDSIELKGRIKNGYFVINRRIQTFPFPIFFTYGENKTIIGNDKEGNLVLIQGQRSNYVILLTLYGGDSDEITARYAKL